MSKTVHIESDAQMQDLIKSSTIVVADFYADWCGPCKQIAPVYEQLSAALSRPKKMTFTKVNVDVQTAVAQRYGISAMPTFIVFKNGAAVETVRGADPRALRDVVQKLAVEAEAADGKSGAAASGFGEPSGSSSAGAWIGRKLPKSYKNITDEVDVRRADLLNARSEGSGAATLFAASQPSALASTGKGKEEDAAAGKQDWVESDTDEQLMLFAPFQSSLKVHTIQITSCPPSASEAEEPPVRPKTVQLYTNRATVLGFDEADGIPATQRIELSAKDWDAATHTASLELRFVKFQNISSLALFVVDGDGDGDRVRVDRIRIIGDSGEKVKMGKLEKAGEGE